MTTRTLDLDWLWQNPGKAFAEKGCRITLDDGIVTSFEYTSDSFASGIAALPPLVNGHDHGRGFKTVGYGASDGPLETWIPALGLSPTADPYMVAAAAFGRMARSGIAATVHCHVPQGGDLFEEASAVARAAKDVGIHVAYAVPIVDRNIEVYGNAASICGQHTAADLMTLKSLTGEPAPAAEQVNLVEALAAQFGSDTFHVQFGPAGPQWCSNEALHLVAERSSATGLRVQMHLLETKVQREWADAAYPAGMLPALDAMGLLSSRLSVSHGVWLTPSECELLASREVTVVVNASSNLRLRSGIASLRNFADAGLQFALGLDGLALDDDDDMLREMRLLSSLNLPSGFSDSKSMWAEIFHAATMSGWNLIQHGSNGSSLLPGTPASLLVLDWAELIRGCHPSLISPEEIFAARSTSAFVKDMYVSGRRVVADHVVTGIDLAAIEAELLEAASHQSGRLLELRPLIAKQQVLLNEFYRSGKHREIDAKEIV